MSYKAERTSILKDGKKLSHKEIADRLNKFEATTTLVTEPGKSAEQPAFNNVLILIVGAAIGLVVVALLIQVVNRIDGLITLFNAVAWIGGFVIGLVLIASFVFALFKLTPKTWEWFKTRWSHIGGPGSTTPEEV